MPSDSSYSSSPVSHRLALPPGFELEGCRIEAVLGKGGFGLTYLAMDTALQVKVAIKELLPDGIATRVRGTTVVAQTEELAEAWDWALRRFEEEARILAQLRHPNIVRVLRLVRAHGTAYMVMEYVEGHSLAEWMADHPRPDEGVLRNLLIPLLDGLDHVHQNRLLHRDISPENIFITAQGKPVLLDFGSARQDLGKTMSVTAVVRHGYSPFEQYQVKTHQGPYTDLYALAGVMSTAMTGQKPPPATDRISDDSLSPPLSQQCRGRYSAVFCSAIDKAFSVLPQDRPQSVAVFRSLLEGGSAPPPMPTGRKNGGTPTMPAYPPIPRRGGAGVLLASGIFACLAIVAACWWFGVELPNRQAETRKLELAQAEESRRQELAHAAEIARLTRENTNAVALAAKAAEDKADAEERARRAKDDATVAMQQQQETERRRKEEEERNRIAAQRRMEDAAEAQRQREAAAVAMAAQEKQVKVDALRSLVNEFIRSLDSDDPSDTSAMYTEWVDDKNWKDEGRAGMAPRSYIEQDRGKYIAEYPSRTYQMLNDGNYTYTLSPSQTTASLEFSYSYYVTGGKKTNSGSSDVRLGLEWSNGRWRINAFDETIHRNRK